MPDLPDDLASPGGASPAEQSYEPSYSPPDPYSGVSDWAREQGLNVDGYSGADVLNAMKEMAFNERPMDPRTAHAIRQAREYQEVLNDPEYQTWQQQRRGAKPPATPAPAAAAPEGFKPPDWPVPEYNETWENTLFVTDPQTGQLIPHPNAPFSNVEKYREYKKWEVNQLRKMVREFPDLARGYAKAEIEDFKKNLHQEFGQFAGKREVEQGTMQYLGHNASDIWVMDPRSGQRAIDPYTGEEILKPLGQLLLYHANQARAHGITDPAKLQRYALEHAEREMFLASLPEYQQQLYAQQQQRQRPQQAAAPNEPPPTPAQRNARNKESYMQKKMRESRQNNAEGYSPGRSEVGVSNGNANRLDLGAMMRETASKMGHSL